MLCQLEIPVEDGRGGRRAEARFICLNAAPARELPDGLLDDVDLLVVNRYEQEAVGRFDGLTALTLGAEGPSCSRAAGRSRARSRPPVEAVDGTAAGDAFTACLLVSLLEGRARRGSAQHAPAPPARSPPRDRARSRPSPPRRR